MSRDSGAVSARQYFGNYEILGVIGQGGMGVVYRAIDHALDRTVALKILRDDLRAQPVLVTRFQREAQAVARISHPNIVHVYSVGAVDAIPYIAMECIEGRPLSSILHRVKRLGWEKALDFSEQIADGLSCAHAAQIIHRDIKPANILITATGHAYLTDFGIAKLLNEEIQLTVDGASLGTPEYMSPERCENEALTPASDIYSLGVVLFQLITGRLPFEAATPMELVKKIVFSPPMRVRDCLPDAPEDIDRLVAWMIERKPKNRPASALAVKEAIARVRSGKPLDESPVEMAQALADFRGSESTPTPRPMSRHTPKPQTGAGKKKNQWKAILAASLVCLVAISATVAWLFAGRSPTVTLDAEQNLALWLQSGDVGSFTNEGTHVRLAHLNFSDMNIADIEFVGDIVVAELTSPKTSRQALVTVAPTLNRVSLRFPVNSASRGEREGWNLLGRGFDDRFLVQYRAPGQECVAAYRLDDDGEMPISLATFPVSRSRAFSSGITSAAMSPDGSLLAIAMSDAESGDSYIALRDTRLPQQEQTNTPLTPQGAPIRLLQFSPDASLLVYTREIGANNVELWSRTVSALSTDGSKLAGGQIEIQRNAFSEDGAALLAIHREDNGQTTLNILDPRGGEVVSRIDGIHAGAWQCDANKVVAVAPDKISQLQLWTLDVSAPESRTQLTFLADGVESVCAVSADGRWAAGIAAHHAEPSLVVVDLSS